MASRGDSILAWRIYIFASITGFVYFIFIIDAIQIFLWGFFVVNNYTAIRRKRKKKEEE